MTDARWFEIDAAVAAAVRHFAGACAIYEKIPAIVTPDDRYLVEMAFLHAMLAGQTLFETALLRILDLSHEEAPTGARWPADLIRQAASRVGDRQAILGEDAARAADETRRFRSISVHACDAFDYLRASAAVEDAARLVSLLPAGIARFRQAIDP